MDWLRQPIEELTLGEHVCRALWHAARIRASAAVQGHGHQSLFAITIQTGVLVDTIAALGAKVLEFEYSV